MCGHCRKQAQVPRLSNIEDLEGNGCSYSTTAEAEFTEEEVIIGSLSDRLQHTLSTALTSNRTNQMTKTHNDLDAILQLLQEKEKDLELAANIGQSLLERNKNLMHKTEAMEDFLEKSFDKEDQLRHEIVMKNELLQKFLKDQEDLFYEPQSEDDLRSSDNGSLCKDDSITTLNEKCHVLEQRNSHLILEALKLKENTVTEEQKERQLVADCVRQMMEAKDHITALTDEISHKAEDNVRQQEEITQLITTVVDLQKNHRQLSCDNEELQTLLSMSQAHQDDLQSKVSDLEKKYIECFEILIENQQEMKSINKKIETPPQAIEASAGASLHDSIACEIEESVKRDLAHIHEKRLNLARVLQTVRNINSSRGKKPKKTSIPHAKRGPTVNSDGSPVRPTSTSSDPSLSSSDEGAATGLDPRHSYARRSFRKPEKLQIVKPMKGSMTLHQWKKLASPTMNLQEARPGVHVKGALQTADDKSDHSDAETDDEDEDDDAPIMMRSKQPRTSTPSADTTTDSLSKRPASERMQPPTTLALTSLVSEQGISAAPRRDSASASILAQLLHSPSATAPDRSSVGQVLASVLKKASEDASTREPKRAESLRNLAAYFSEKERTVGPSPIPEDDSPPVSPPSVPLPPASMTGSIFSRMLGSSAMNISLPTPQPVTTMAAPTSNVTTTSSAPLLGRPGFGRTSSGSNLKGLLNSSASFPDTDTRHSLVDVSAINSYAPNLYTNSTATSFPTLRRRASSGDLEKMASSHEHLADVGGFGGRLIRSSSSGNLQDLSQVAHANINTSLDDPGTSQPVGFFGRLRRRPSLGSLTDLIQRSNIGAIPIGETPRVQRSSSIDSAAVFQPGQSPPSPTRFEGDAGAFFTPGSGQAASAAPAVSGFFSGSRLSSLAGVRGLWSQGSAEVRPQTPPPAPSGMTRSDQRLEKINKAFALEDFGGMGLMSFFGGKTQNSSPPK